MSPKSSSRCVSRGLVGSLKGFGAAHATFRDVSVEGGTSVSLSDLGGSTLRLSCPM